MTQWTAGTVDFGTIASLSTSSTDGTWTRLGRPLNRFTITAVFSSGTSGTVILQGATSSGSTAALALTLVTVDNTTQIGYNSSAINCTWVRARATAISTGGNASAITVGLVASV